MKKMICAVLSAILLLTITFPVYAAGNVKPQITVYKYNDESGKYDLFADKATKGDLLFVRVAFNQKISSIASLRLKLSYDDKKISFVTGSFTPELVTGDAYAGNPIFTQKSGAITVFWGKDNMMVGNELLGTSAATNVAGFLFFCDGEYGNAEFKATFDNAISADFKDVAMKARSATTMVAVEKWQATADTKAVFEKLEQIVYAPGSEKDSKADITMADTVWKGFTAAEKLSFVDAYPKLYEYYQSAWTRYYDASLEASLAEIRAEVARFVEENEYALKIIEPSAINESNYESVLKAIESYGKMTSKAQVEALSYKKQLDALSAAAKAVEAQIEADMEAQEYFINPYENILWNLKDSDITDETYADYMAYVAEAKAEYQNLSHDNLSDAMMKKVDSYYKILETLEKKIAEVAKEVGEDKEIQEEINAFTEKWHVVTRLTALNVGVNDQTAIEMMLQDFDKLSPTAQQRLAARKTMAEQLLQLIDSMNKLQDNNSSSSGGSISLVPSGGTTQQIIKEVPVETLVTQTRSNMAVRNVPMVVYIMMILALVSVMSCAVPVVIYVVGRRKRN